MIYKPSKLGQTDLVFGLQSEFISMSVHAGFEVNMCSSCAILVNRKMIS